MYPLQHILSSKQRKVTLFFFDPKMFVVSYCQIYSFHPGLNLEKIVIFRSFQQSADEIYDLSHFRLEHVAFFDRAAFYQLKDAASAVLACEKSTYLAELFSIELKFTIDPLNASFSDIVKPKFLEINDIKKQILVTENPIVPSKTTCHICGFLLDVQARGEHERWHDFIAECEYLFLRNI